ncbi:hypothetical protein EUGRSUZ_F02301 [Eucalyptus grandis]|uniref:Uncharacterized protein n=2 Tax=Eucalyptus grandis TaxID=71139 RepID=A0ACC3KH10_EUCGR|nr:hypothetical protein EUGRSUZ_F02301 [Eucalyptus grandis]
MFTRTNYSPLPKLFSSFLKKKNQSFFFFFSLFPHCAKLISKVLTNQRSPEKKKKGDMKKLVSPNFNILILILIIYFTFSLECCFWCIHLSLLDLLLRAHFMRLTAA